MTAPRPSFGDGAALRNDGDQSQQASDALAVSDRADPIDPPIVTPMLPWLVPSPTVGTPSLSVASATVRQGAWSEAFAGEEDLDALAAKIKLILDEEARRHGIDV